MTVGIPDHDTLIKQIQEEVVAAVRTLGWPDSNASCRSYGISVSLLRKVYLWDERESTSFSLKKLLEAHSWAYDVNHGLRVKG